MLGFYDKRADLYDIAFAWDVGSEVDWLIQRLGPTVKFILEPACGSGRMFPAFVERRVEVVGIELSETMIDRAKNRMAAVGIGAPRIILGDMTRFDLGETFDGAICPINSFAYLLTREDALSHLECMERHLKPGAKYLIQLDLNDVEAGGSGDSLAPCEREAEEAGISLRANWGLRRFDPSTYLDTQYCRFEILDGPGAGSITEDDHIMRRWSWADWSSLVDASAFELRAAYNGSTEAREPLPLDRGLEDAVLTWHELVV